MKKSNMFGLVLLGLLLCAACASNKVNTGVSVKVLETIPSTSAPQWVNKTQDFWSDKSAYFYRGMAEGFTNLEAAKRAATASARVSLAEQVKSTVRAEFSRALEAGAYDDVTGGYLKDSFYSAVENLTLSGVRVQESYLQRLLEVGVNNAQRMYYRAYVLVSINKDDYDSLVRRAFSDTKAQVAANKSAKELAAETEARFWKAQAVNQ